MNFVETCSELALFGVIYSLGGFIFYALHDSADGRLEWTPALQEAVERAQSKLESAVDQVARFGVEKPRTDEGATPEYWEWYRKTKAEWEQLTEDVQAGLVDATTKNKKGLVSPAPPDQPIQKEEERENA